MGQLGFFDADKRLQALSARGDPLEAIDHLVPWESFRAEIEAVVLTPDELKKSSAGRKPFDAILMFRMLVLQALNNLSDEQVEYQVRDRLSFSRFLGLAIEDSIPDATTLWLFREKLAKAEMIEKLFDRFDQHLAAKGYMARGGQIIDASIVPVPTQRNSRDENAELQAGRTPAGWKQKPGKVRQKDRDGRWTKKHGRSFFGYKNHVNADAKHNLIRHRAGEIQIGMMNLGYNIRRLNSARADGACARLSALTGGVRVSCKRPARRQSGPRSGGPPWHRCRNRSLSQSRVLFEVRTCHSAADPR